MADQTSNNALGIRYLIHSR